MAFIKIKKLHPDAIIPQYATPGSAGFDLHALEDGAVEPGQVTTVRTGIALQLAEGYVLMICGRSGLAKRHGARIAQGSAGIVDQDYTGEIMVLLSTEQPFVFNKGDRIAQGVITPYRRAIFMPVDTLEETKRGSGGFGHSGK